MGLLLFFCLLLVFSLGIYYLVTTPTEVGNGMRFGINYFSTHNHYEPYYLSDKELERDFRLFQDQGLDYVSLCAIWKYHAGGQIVLTTPNPFYPKRLLEILLHV